MTEQRQVSLDTNHSPYSIYRLSPAVKDFLAGKRVEKYIIEFFELS